MSTPQEPATAPGRLGDPGLGPGTDPRTDGLLRPLLLAFGVGEATRSEAPDGPVLPEQVADVARTLHEQYEQLAAQIPLELPGDERVRVVRSRRCVITPDGRELELGITRPEGVDGVLPCVVYLHGGELVFAWTWNRIHQQWCTDLAAAGAVVVQVDFRNAWTPEGFHPFPAALDDCIAALSWVHDHRAELGIGSVVLQGESGGGNLAIATALRAKREGLLDAIDGVHAHAPLIMREKGWDEERVRRELPSRRENEGYLISDAAEFEVQAEAYDPGGRHAQEPLAWPLNATVEDLAGLPPHVVVVDELDPLRDEGIAYQRRLTAAGVPALGRVELGMVHCGAFTFRQALAPYYMAQVRDVVSFARSLLPADA
ncbi:alpha/beta hydrolase fold domain-containing protein [Blastococcus sp. SYSU D00695]